MAFECREESDATECWLYWSHDAYSNLLFEKKRHESGSVS